MDSIFKALSKGFKGKGFREGEGEGMDIEVVDNGKYLGR